MFRLISATFAVALIAAPAAASTYSAIPAQATTQRIIARDIVWNCGPAACQGSTQESRPAVICEGLAKKAGRIASFAVDGRAFSSAEIERCNAAAKGQPAKSLAAQ